MPGEKTPYSRRREPEVDRDTAHSAPSSTMRAAMLRVLKELQREIGEVEEDSTNSTAADLLCENIARAWNSVQQITKTLQEITSELDELSVRAVDACGDIPLGNGFCLKTGVRKLNPPHPITGKTVERITKMVALGDRGRWNEL